jgi:hypothetical protein
MRNCASEVQCCALPRNDAQRATKQISFRRNRFTDAKKCGNEVCVVTSPDGADALADAGFIIERICEPTPSEKLKLKDPKGYDRLCRLPAFIFVRARKDIS